VTGVLKRSPAPSQNAAAYAAWARDNRLAPAVAPAVATANAAAATAPAGAAPPAPQAVMAGPRADAATLAAGARVFATACASCHTLERGAPHGVGPNLWGIGGATAAARPDFAYSGALEASGLAWSTDNLSRFVTAPQQLVPGTLMASVGIAQDADRRALLAFLAARTAPAAAAGDTPPPRNDDASARE
jgi:cytochrome c